MGVYHKSSQSTFQRFRKTTPLQVPIDTANVEAYPQGSRRGTSRSLFCGLFSNLPSSNFVLKGTQGIYKFNNYTVYTCHHINLKKSQSVNITIW